MGAHFNPAGPSGVGVALVVAEPAIACGLMTVVLAVSNTTGLQRFTGLVARALAATYIGPTVGLRLPHDEVTLGRSDAAMMAPSGPCRP